MSANGVRHRLAAIRAALDEARASVADGGTVDLTGIDEAVRAVCEDIALKDAGSERGELEATIRSLLADFDALGQALGDQHRRAIAGSGVDSAMRSAYGAGRDPDEGEAGEN